MPKDMLTAGYLLVAVTAFQMALFHALPLIFPASVELPKVLQLAREAEGFLLASEVFF